MSFGKQIADFRVKTESAADRIVRGLTIELFAGVVRDTPVDTGHARGNWQTSIATPQYTQINRYDKGGSESVAEIIEKTPPKAGSKTFLANNLPYIKELEDGSSRQAPNGMVKVNFLRVHAILGMVVAKNKV